jgi:hypothetical protein
MTDKNKELAQLMLQIAEEIESRGIEVYHKHHRNYGEVATINCGMIDRKEIVDILEGFDLDLVSYSVKDPKYEDKFVRVKFSNK